MNILGNTDWAQKYRPRNLQEVVLPSAIEKKLTQTVKEGSGMSLLFYGRQGTGKTSTACAINPDSLFHVDCSRDRSIGMVRNLLDKCSSVCLHGRRVVVLDEIDSLTAEAQNALKGAIERLSACNDFVGVTNHIEKVPDAIKSRLYPVSFDHPRDSSYTDRIESRLRVVLAAEGRRDPPSAVLRAIVRDAFPDIRSMLKRLQFETA